jgi:hypothetical protein
VSQRMRCFIKERSFRHLLLSMWTFNTTNSGCVACSAPAGSLAVPNWSLEEPLEGVDQLRRHYLHCSCDETCMERTRTVGALRVPN